MYTNTITGHLVLIMAPSGSGKGLLIEHLRALIPSAHFPVSCTTREPRPGEKDGEMYYFVSKEEFEEKIKEDVFLEWAEFGGDLYGTLKSEIIPALLNGKVVVREVELQGILAFQQLFKREHYTVVYIDAGEWTVLCRRILARAPMTDIQLESRHARYLEESKWKVFADKIIVNNEGRVEEAKKELVEFIEEITRKCSL